MATLQPSSNGKARPHRVTEKLAVFAPRPSRAELVAQGKAMRGKCPRSSHAAWNPPHTRPDPVELVAQSNEGRLPELIPLRHERMLQSPFTYYRGTALNMAVDLAKTPTTGFRVQACGDAHLGNFRCFATPERRVIFDINDLDETLPAPWEWDVKRLAASFVVACRMNLSEKDGRDAALECVRSYRTHMAEFSKMRALDVWYASLEAEALFATIKDEEIRARTQKRLAKKRESVRSKTTFPSWRVPRAEPPSSRRTRRPCTTTSTAARKRFTRRSRTSSPATENRCGTIDGFFWTAFVSRTWRSRWWAWAASAPSAAWRS